MAPTNQGQTSIESLFNTIYVAKAAENYALNNQDTSQDITYNNGSQLEEIADQEHSFDPSIIENILSSLPEEQREQLQKYHSYLEQKIETVTEKAERDDLTGLYKRQPFEEFLEKEISKASRNNYADISLLIVDIDHFKKVNDTYGHQKGDEVIKYVADTMQNVLRDYDFISRYGGEEFIAALPHTTIDEGYEIADRLNKELKQHEFKHYDAENNIERKFSVTASIGLSHYKNQANDKEQLIEYADKALYQAKETRDTVKIYSNA